MDIPTLAYVYEGFDAGYGAYVGFHIVRKTHTHPIMLSFIALLLELKNSHAKEESKKSDAFLRARVSIKPLTVPQYQGFIPMCYGTSCTTDMPKLYFSNNPWSIAYEISPRRDSERFLRRIGKCSTHFTIIRRYDFTENIIWIVDYHLRNEWVNHQQTSHLVAVFSIVAVDEIVQLPLYHTKNLSPQKYKLYGPCDPDFNLQLPETRNNCEKSHCRKILFLRYKKSIRKFMATYLEIVISVVVGTGDNIRRVIVTSGTNVHTIVGLDVTASSIVTRDTTLGFLFEFPAGVFASNTVDGIDEDISGLFNMLLRVPFTLL